MRIVLIGFFCLFLVELSAQKKKENGSEVSQEQRLKSEALLIEGEKQLVLENTAKAAELFQSTIELNPSNDAAYFKLAEINAKSDLPKALPYALDALELDTQNKYYYLLAAEIYKGLGDLKKSAALYQYMIDELPDTETYYYDLAVLYQYIGEFDRALEIYKKAEDYYGPNELALRERQKIYLKTNDIDALIADWDRLIKANPEKGEYVVEICEFLMTKGFYDEVETRVEWLKDDKARYYKLKSELALSKGQTDEAKQMLIEAYPTIEHAPKQSISVIDKILDLSISEEDFQLVIGFVSDLSTQFPADYEVQAYAGDVLYRLEQHEQARNHYLNALKIDASNYTLWQNVLNVEAGLAQYDSVAVHAEEALEYFPNQAPLYYFAGTAQMVGKEYRKAIRLLENGVKFTKDPALVSVFYGQLGDAYHATKKYVDSYNAYDNALKNNPRNDHVLNNYSYYLSLDKVDLDKALEMSTLLIELAPQNATYLDTHGWVLYVRKDYKLAEEFLKKAASLDKAGAILEHYGDVLFRLGKVDDAVQQWKKASDVGSASELIDKKIADKKLYE